MRALRRRDRGRRETALPLPPLQLGILLWALLWVALNTGPWEVARLGAGTWSTIHGLRALLPVGVLVAWAADVAGRDPRALRIPTAPEGWWILYGVVGMVGGLVATGFGPDSLYWAAAFLAPFAAVEMLLWRNDAPRRALELNLASWLAAGAALAVLIAAAGDQLLTADGLFVSARGVINRTGEIAGMPMSRSNGLARLAAVVGVASGVQAVRTTGGSRFGWGAVAAAAAAFVWITQSRGGLVAFAGGVGLVAVLLWRGASALLAAGTAGLLVVAVPALDLLSLVERIAAFATRGQEVGLSDRTFSGRLGIWRNALSSWSEGPIFGSGFQADRRLLDRNASNGAIYALLTGGVVGALAYLTGLALAWHRLLRCLERLPELPRRYRTAVVQTAGVLAVLSLRHIPENTSALFSVDLLLMLPAVAFLGELARTSPDALGEDSGASPGSGR